MIVSETFTETGKVVSRTLEIRGFTLSATLQKDGTVTLRSKVKGEVNEDVLSKQEWDALCDLGWFAQRRIEEIEKENAGG